MTSRPSSMKPEVLFWKKSTCRPYIFRIRKMRSIGCLKEEFEDTKGAIRIRISKKNRQHNGQKDKQRSTRHTYKTKDRVTRTPLKTGGELRWSGRVSSSCSTSDTHLIRHCLCKESSSQEDLQHLLFKCSITNRLNIKHQNVNKHYIWWNY
jgi:hypothetical protein